jgi:hypothetical protein
MALAIVLGAFAIMGCSGDDTSPIVTATSGDLNNRAFAFPNGAGPELAAVFGLPQGQAFTLQFDDFGGTNIGPVTLDSGGSAAHGTVTLGSCTFRFDLTTFPAGVGPQSGTQFTIDPCQVNRDNNTLQLATASGESLVSTPALPLATTNVALVLTTDGSTGSYSVVDLASRHVFKDLKLGGIHSNAIARFFGGRVYVVNRLGADSIQILDPQRGFITPTNGVLSVGNGSDPQDIVFVNDSKAYVSRLNSPRLLIINPRTLQRTGELDLSGLAQPNDSDGSPDPGYMLMLNGMVYVALRHLDVKQPQLPQVACFDTSFHRGAPSVAELVPLPAEIRSQGVQRYGFHGLSYEYIASVLPEVAPEIARGRVIVAHLGSGASLCAIRDGRSIESTMGFTALEGLPMGTRCGQIDPGVLLYLLGDRGMSVEAVTALLYHESGLLGLSGVSSDMRDLLASDAPRAREAVEYFVYRAAGLTAALATALGGVDGIVFTAGIGAHAVAIRARICARLTWLGVELDEAANAAGGPRISTAAARVSAWVVPTDEEQMIALHVTEVLGTR